jgi:Cys-tRNA(Pro)/Cys-tRNA(Cys) deacylase
MHRTYPIYIDETVILWPRVGVSAGAKGLEILLAPQDLINVIGAVSADIARSAL